jgi:VanZ family protein
MILIWLKIQKAKLKSMNNFHYYLKFLFWTSFVVINILALSPAPYLPPLEIFNWWDKAQHAIAFAVLAVLAVLAYPEVSKLRIAVLLIGQGVLIELLQYHGGYRFGDWQDAVADGVGVLLGLAMVRVMDFWLCDKNPEHVDKN